MRVFVIGDVVGKNGVSHLQSVLPAFKRTYGVDLCVANGENSSESNGITPESAEELFSYGVDVITTGNHAFRHRAIYDYYDEHEFVLRPVNFPPDAPGRGFCIVDKGSVRVGIVNLMGTMYLESLDNPFRVMETVLPELSDCRIKIVDFHAEATSEKRAMGFFLDGNVSAVFGTHTHVQTADEQILPGGTGYMTDVGMTGTVQSVLGVKPDIIIQKFRSNLPQRFLFEEGPAMLCGCIFDIDNKTGLTTSVERICLT